MSKVTPERWALWLGEMPMPEGATEEMMWAAYDAIRAMDRRDEAIQGIAFFTEMLQRYEKSLKEAQDWGDIEKVKIIQNTIEMTNSIINTYRSWLE